LRDEAPETDLIVREERAEDIAAVHRVNRLAFGGPGEAALVDHLRALGKLRVSLVAERRGEILGHIAFSPVRLVDDSAAASPHARPGPRAGAMPGGLGIGPMAVVPEHQRRGIGGRLMRAGLERCRALDVPWVIVLGHPSYYPRFGFTPASRFGVRCAYPAPDEAFMALELVPGALRGAAGTAHYEPEFDGV
jgi:putative acetyltransferase